MILRLYVFFLDQNTTLNAKYKLSEILKSTKKEKLIMADSTADQNNNIGLSVRSSFYQNLYLPVADQNRIWGDLNQLKECFGYDLIAVMSLFHQHKMSAKIILTVDTKTKHSITFEEGQIQFIEIADSDTRIGTLLINHRLITKALLDKALTDKGDLPIGTYLVQKGYVSKEQIGQVLLTQSRLRLSKLISEEKFQLNLEKSNIKIQTSEININQFYVLINDWILSKFDQDWIHAHYLEYYHYKIQVNWTNLGAIDTTHFSLLSLLGETFFDLIEGQVIQNLVSTFENNAHFFKAIHFLVITNIIEIDPSSEKINYEIRIKHIYKLLMNKNGSDLAYITGLITKQNPHEIDKIYEDLNQNYLGPETLHNDFKLEIDRRMINLMIHQKNIKSSESNNESQSKARNQKAVDANLIKNMLQAQKYNEALVYIKKYKDQIHTEPKLQLFSAWSHLGLALFKGTQISPLTLEKEFTSILPEDMGSADYHYVNYLFLKSKKQDTPANNALKQAILQDSNIKNYPTIKSIFDWFS